MRQAKKRSKRKRSRAALPLLGAAGVSLTMAGGASANAPAVEVPPQDSGPRILLAEEEIFDVSLATFYVFDKEAEIRPRRAACSRTWRLRRRRLSRRRRLRRLSRCRHGVCAWRPRRRCRPSGWLGRLWRWLQRWRLQRLQRLRRLRLWPGLMDRRLCRLWWRLRKLLDMGSGPGLGLRLLS